MSLNEMKTGKVVGEIKKCKIWAKIYKNKMDNKSKQKNKTQIRHLNVETLMDNESKQKSKLALRNFRTESKPIKEIKTGICRGKYKIDNGIKQNHTNEKLISCRKCNKTYNDELNMYLHYYNNHSQDIDLEIVLEPSACPECDFKCSNNAEFKEHLLRHKAHTSSYIKRGKSFVCKECDKEHADETDMYFHVYNYHRQNVDVEILLEPYECSKCAFKCSNNKVFQDHIERHNLQKITDGRPYPCKECGKKYTCDLDLNFHSLNEHKKCINVDILLEPFACMVCGFKSSSNIRFQRHMKRHKSPSSDSCKKCTFECSCVTFLKSPVSKLAEKPTDDFKCFNSEPDKDGGHGDEEVNVFTCTDCGTSFKYHQYLKWHLLTHGDKTYYACPDCEYKTIYRSDFKRHQKQHSTRSYCFDSHDRS